MPCIMHIRGSFLGGVAEGVTPTKNTQPIFLIFPDSAGTNWRDSLCARKAKERKRARPIDVDGDRSRKVLHEINVGKITAITLYVLRRVRTSRSKIVAAVVRSKAGRAIIISAAVTNSIFPICSRFAAGITAGNETVLRRRVG